VELRLGPSDVRDYILIAFVLLFVSALVGIAVSCFIIELRRLFRSLRIQPVHRIPSGLLRPDRRTVWVANILLTILLMILVYRQEYIRYSEYVR